MEMTMNWKTFLAALALPLAATAAQAAYVELWRLDCGSIEVKDLSVFSDTYDYGGVSRTLTDSCYLVRHDKTYMLWDTGLPGSMLGKAQQPTFGMTPSLAKTIVAQLAGIDVKPADISIVGISHNHFDHLGQAADFPHARMLIGRLDLAGLKANPPPLAVDASLAAPWLTGEAEVEPVSGDKDVFGDGSVVMLATPGHTADSHSLLVRLTEKGPVLLSGDTVHFEQQFENHGVPAFNVDRAESLASMDRLQTMAKTLKATLVVQHDADDFAKLPAFPASAK
jgi:glyoxylase-like metal-dependent hydrolase (beta-lactamase superfamily II)